MLLAMKAEPGIFEQDDEAAIAASDARALAHIAAGRVWPHAIVAEWLKTWGTPDRKPFHEWLASRGG
ncbi:antitoxin [Sphingomonas sp. GlSt437]|uniref:antitoxin n=1 Tax=Sphingomonas sp. GlSt437 TaxID=3389970 RepID=UPI003A8B3AEB